MAGYPSSILSTIRSGFLAQQRDNIFPLETTDALTQCPAVHIIRAIGIPAFTVRSSTGISRYNASKSVEIGDLR